MVPPPNGRNALCFAEFFVVEKALGVKGGGVVAKDGGVEVQLTVGDEDFGAGAQCDGQTVPRSVGSATERMEADAVV